jgi:hypothetical protein
MAAVRMLKAVDFPAPFGPSKPKIVDFYTPNDTPFKAIVLLLYFFAKSFTRRESLF